MQRVGDTGIRAATPKTEEKAGGGPDRASPVRAPTEQGMASQWEAPVPGRLWPWLEIVNVARESHRNGGD